MAAEKRTGQKAPFSRIRYEPDEQMPPMLALGLAAQLVLLVLADIVLTPMIVAQAGGETAEMVAWAVFMSLAASGIGILLQAVGWGRIGARYLLVVGPGGAQIAVAIAAVEAGGMALLMTLTVVAALFQMFLALRLSLFRQLFTPVVGGTALMLVTVAVMPVAFALLSQTPTATAGHPVFASYAAPAAAAATLGSLVLLSTTNHPYLQLWGLVIGLSIGIAVAWVFGLVDPTPLHTAPWFGLPEGGWPQPDLSFGANFWEMLPAFLIVTLVASIGTYGVAMSIQRVSWRKRRAVDYRAIQGALFADGTSSLLAGLGGTLPQSCFSDSVTYASLNGVASRSLGVWAGGLILALAFSPKVAAAVLIIPKPVVGASLLFMLILLFINGLRLVTAKGLTQEAAMVVGLGFWLGVGFQENALFNRDLTGWTGVLFNDGLIAGTLVALGATMLFRLNRRWDKVLRVPLAPASVPAVLDFVRNLAEKVEWDPIASIRLQLAAEETLNILMERAPEETARGLQLAGSEADGCIDLTLVAAPDHSPIALRTNLEDAIAAYREHMPDCAEAESAELPFRLLAGVAEELTHQVYHNVDVLTVRVAPGRES